MTVSCATYVELHVSASLSHIRLFPASTYNTIGLRVSLNHLEFNGSHATTDKEGVALADGSIGFQEVGLEESLKEVTSQTFHSVINRQDVDTLTVLDIRAGMEGQHITKTNTQVVADNFFEG